MSFTLEMFFALNFIAKLLTILNHAKLEVFYKHALLGRFYGTDDTVDGLITLCFCLFYILTLSHNFVSSLGHFVAFPHFSNFS